MAIRFGTSGWRAVMADEFTFSNVRRAVEGIARYLDSRQGRKSNSGGSRSRRVLVGYDTRFLSRQFADTAARVLLSHDLEVALCSSPTPTPTIAYELVKDKQHPWAGAINITASHNPPEYNGIKFSSSDGAPALPEVTKAIEAMIEGIADRDVRPVPNLEHPRFRWVTLEKSYVRRLTRLIDVAAIRRAKLRMVYDAQHGTGTSVFQYIARELRLPITLIHSNPDPSFGGHAPDPSEENLRDLHREMKRQHAALGLSTDGDADRFGILDQDGTFITPNEILALALDYLIAERHWQGGVCRSVATTHLVDAVAALHHREVFETPVGFKFIGEMIKQDRVVIGGEESAGLTIRGHVPEKDGILACLLAAEMVAVRRKSLKRQRAELFRQVGPFYNRRLNVPLGAAQRAEVQKKIENLPRLLNNLGKFPKVIRENALDGRKLLLEDGSWVLIRLSGTEPMARCYFESRTAGRLKELLRAVERTLTAN